MSYILQSNKWHLITSLANFNLFNKANAEPFSSKGSDTLLFLSFGGFELYLMYAQRRKSNRQDPRVTIFTTRLFQLL